MRTKLEYCVVKEEYYDYKEGKLKTRIPKWGRGYQFTVSGATEHESREVENDFAKYLEQYGYEAYGIEDYLDIPVKDMDAKEEIKELYAEWKAQRKGN